MRYFTAKEIRAFIVWRTKKLPSFIPPIIQNEKNIYIYSFFRKLGFVHAKTVVGAQQTPFKNEPTRPQTQ